jgi:putative transposase
MPAHLRRYDEPGHVHFWTISCFQRLTFFWDDRVKLVAIDGLHYIRKKHGICLIGYVIMPEHVHLLIYPHPPGSDHPVPVSRILHDFKQYVGYHGKERLRDYWREHGQLWSAPLNDWAHGKLGERAFWIPRGYDFNIIQDIDTLIEKLNYCHKNPITRGLVERPEDWHWSSYRYYELNDRSVIQMDWNGSLPIIW